MEAIYFRINSGKQKLRQINMKKLIENLTPKKQDLFSIQTTMLTSFALINFKFDCGLWFIFIVAGVTIAMDFVYKACK